MARTLVGTGALLLAVVAAVPDVGIGQQTSSSSSLPRTPWGDPDIQGVFTTDDELGVPNSPADHRPDGAL